MIKGKFVILRAPEPRDLELLHKWSNDPELWRNLGSWHFPYSARSTAEWIAARKDSSITDQVFCVEAPDVGLIGTSNLVNIDWKNRHALHGMMLGDTAARGKGYALDAQQALLRYAFDELGMHRLDGDIIEYNTRSLKFYEKCGWKVEGTQRDWHFRGGRWYDRLLMGITVQDYRDMLAATRYWETAPESNAVVFPRESADR